MPPSPRTLQAAVGAALRLVMAVFVSAAALAGCVAVPTSSSSSTPLGDVASRLPAEWLSGDDEVLVLTQWRQVSSRPAFWGTLFRGLGPAKTTTETRGVTALFLPGRELASLNRRNRSERSQAGMAGCAFGPGAVGCGSDVLTSSVEWVERLCVLHRDGGVVALTLDDMKARPSTLGAAEWTAVAAAVRDGAASAFARDCGIEAPAEWDDALRLRVRAYLDDASRRSSGVPDRR